MPRASKICARSPGLGTTCPWRAKPGAWVPCWVADWSKYGPCEERPLPQPLPPPGTAGLSPPHTLLCFAWEPGWPVSSRPLERKTQPRTCLGGELDTRSARPRSLRLEARHGASPLFPPSPHSSATRLEQQNTCPDTSDF